jgi:hypothetical protein
MWSEAVRLCDDHDFDTLILDTEGLNSIRKFSLIHFDSKERDE